MSFLRELVVFHYTRAVTLANASQVIPRSTLKDAGERLSRSTFPLGNMMESIQMPNLLFAW